MLVHPGGRSTDFFKTPAKGGVRIDRAALIESLRKHGDGRVNSMLEGTMAERAKAMRVLIAPKRPDSFTRAELLKAIKKVAAARRRRLQPLVSDGAK